MKYLTSLIALFINSYSIAQDESSLLGKVNRLLTDMQQSQSGMYVNRIPDEIFTNAVTEICFKETGVRLDENSPKVTLNGGGCNPGDKGFVFTGRSENVQTWHISQIECLKKGMRLPELFELQAICAIDEEILNGEEWSSNSPFPIIEYHAQGNTYNGTGAITLSSCFDSGSFAWITRNDNNHSNVYYRCVK